MPTRNTIVAVLVLIITVLLTVSCPEEPERTYTITYQLDGGTNAVDNPSTYTAESAAIILQDPSRPGYTFAGWFDDAAYTEPALTEIPAGSVGDITLYAKWSANTYIVTFDAQGGTAPSPPTSTVTFGTAYGTLPTTTFSDTGYEFGGWYTATNGAGTNITATTVVDTASDHTLYAFKAAISYGITYLLDGGTNNAGNPDTYTIATATITLASPTKTGYAFEGWYGDATFAGSAITTIPLGSTGTISLYAKWSANTYTISFDAAGGSPATPGTKSVTYDGPYGALATTTRTGYTFAGWYTEAGGSGTLVASTSTMHLAADHTLYASWTANTYTLTFDASGGSTADPTTKTVTYDTTYGSLASSTRTGYTLAGWYTGIGGTGTEIESTTVVGTAADHTVYAKWTANTYTASFDSQGGTAPVPASQAVLFNTTYGDLATTTRTGYSFDGWYTASTGGTKVESTTVLATAADHTLYAHWTANSYTVTFLDTQGTDLSQTTATVTFDTAYGTLATISSARAGYVFDGWFTAADGGGTRITATSTVATAADHQLHPHWSPIAYSVTFDAQLGSTADPESKEVVFDSAYGELALTSRTGYTFDGWYTAMGGGGTSIDASTLVTTASDHTLYANWIANTYTATFDAQGGTAPSIASKTVTYASAYGSLATTTSTKTGYDFGGWWTEEDGGGQLIEATSTVTIYQDHTLYAYWDPITYIATLDVQGGTAVSPDFKYVTFDYQYGSFPETTRSAYTFVGWYTGIGGTGTHVSATTILKSTGDHTLYAYWTPVVYNITYNLAGGTNNGANPETYTIESTTITFADPTRTGYTFDGWYGNAEYSGSEVTQIAGGSSGNQSIYAKWTPNTYTVTFNPQDGTASSPTSKIVTFDATYGVLASTTRTGYDFMGWFTEPGGSGNEISDTTLVATASDHTLYAYWNPTVYTITYGNMESGTNHAANPATFTIESSTITFQDPLKEGCYFDGWYAEESFDTLVETLDAGSIGNVTIHAKWGTAYALRSVGPADGYVFYENPAYDYRSPTWRYLEVRNREGSGTRDIWCDTDDISTTVGETVATIGYGKENTDRIIDILGSTSLANKIQSAATDGFSDWFLPSVDELEEIHTTLNDNGIDPMPGHNDLCWSSTEGSATNAWTFNIKSGDKREQYKENLLYVLEVRRFR